MPPERPLQQFTGVVDAPAAKFGSRPVLLKSNVLLAQNVACRTERKPFCSGISWMLRCRKELGQFAEVLGSCGEDEFVICATGAT